MGAREHSYLAPGKPGQFRVTTDAAYYEQHSDSIELWSPGNPLFPAAETAVTENLAPAGLSIRRLLSDCA